MYKVDNNLMSEPTLSAAAVRRIEQRYEQLKNELLELGWISQGSLMRQLPNAWRWTYKVKTKTVTVALYKEQAELYQKAITNHRKLEKLLRQMRELSQQVLLGSAPGVRKRARRKHPKSSLS
jgi:hypothetical protein